MLGGGSNLQVPFFQVILWPVWQPLLIGVPGNRIKENSSEVLCGPPFLGETDNFYRKRAYILCDSPSILESSIERYSHTEWSEPCHCDFRSHPYQQVCPATPCLPFHICHEPHPLRAKLAQNFITILLSLVSSSEAPSMGKGKNVFVTLSVDQMEHHVGVC